MKKIIKQICTVELCIAIVAGSKMPMVATNSTADVYATQGTSFSVNIPKTLVLDGDNGTGAYTVAVKGNIGGTDVINVVPDSAFNMTQTGKPDIVTSIKQSKMAFSYADGLTDTNEVKGLGELNMDHISAGKWAGVFNFNIESTVDLNLKDSICSVKEDITNTTMVGQDVSQDKETIYNIAKIEGLTLNTNEVDLGSGDTYRLKVKTGEKDITNYLTWTSDNSSITVDSGVIETKASAKVGDVANITGTLENIDNLTAKALNIMGFNTFYAADNLSVTAVVRIIDISYKNDSNEEINSISLYPGENKTIKAEIIPSSDKKVLWSSNAISGITLIKNGNICTIKASEDMSVGNFYLIANLGSYSKLLNIIIKSKEPELLQTFNYTGDVQTFTVPETGTYQLEAYGAQGCSKFTAGGKGGYAKGNIELLKGDILNVYVGGQPTNSEPYKAGYNGGGAGVYSNAADFWISGGGGATDFRLNDNSINNRFIVAGGGAGSCKYYVYGCTSGGYGGGLTGGSGVYLKHYSDTAYYTATGGTQTSSGRKSGYSSNDYSGTIENPGCSSGGGYYPGGAAGTTTNVMYSGGGGSSYIGNLLNAETTSGVQSGNGIAYIYRIYN